MACVDLKFISSKECMGNSLSSINGNFAALSSAVCNFNVIDSSSVDLTFDSMTRTLSADVDTITDAIIFG